MIVACSVAEAVAAGRVQRFDASNFVGFVDRVFHSAPGDPQPGPQAYRVRQDPNTVVPLHFHLQDEWQVFTRGTGRMGRHETTPVTVHYASKEAAYGPIVSGPEGLEYFTLRPVTDPGMWILPEHRDRMRTGLRKHQVSARHDLAPACDGLSTVISPQASGVAAWSYRARRGETAVAPPADGRSRFYFIASGAYDFDGQSREALTCIFAPGAQEQPRLTAVEDGSTVLVLQFASGE